MFISQVIFESEKENENILREILKNKKIQLESSKLIEWECWWKNGGHMIGFAIVSKWQDKEDFKNWIKESHADGHHKKNTDKVNIKKTVFQFEAIDK